MNARRIIDGLKRRIDRYIRIPLAHRKFHNINILSSMDSIDFIIRNKYSVSRFGDGEFFVMMGKGNSFQHPNAELGEQLKKGLIATDAPNHYIGIPLHLKDDTNLVPESKEFWGYFTLRYADLLLPYISAKRTYLDTQLSRFYIAYKDKSHCQDQLMSLKKIWNNKDIVIIEGCKSRTGVGNDLYANAKSIKRILGPATDAFRKYPQMLEAITTHVSKDNLILLSYGMTATVLAYDLAKLGYWAIDIGHLDIEYEWMRLGVTEKVAISGKFTNEAENQGGHEVVDCQEKEYLDQIICDITR